MTDAVVFVLATIGACAAWLAKAIRERGDR